MPGIEKEDYVKSIVAEKIKLRRIRNRAWALYHSCLSSAFYARTDSDTEGNENEQTTLLGASQAYECAAGWLKGLIDII